MNRVRELRPLAGMLARAIGRIRGRQGERGGHGGPAVRRRAARSTRSLLAAAATALVAAGCGAGVAAPDLFIAERLGATAGARLTLLINEEGSVRCNGGSELKLSDPQIIQARAIQEELKEPAEARLSLPARAGSVLSYRVRDENGSVRFADNSTGQPRVLRNLALFMLQVAQSVCRLPQQSA